MKPTIIFDTLIAITVGCFLVGVCALANINIIGRPVTLDDALTSLVIGVCFLVVLSLSQE